MLQRQHMTALREKRPSSLSAVREAIINCNQCPRLRDYCVGIGLTRKAAFRNDTYWARPVPGFGDPAARILIVGLAPAAHGANRTGRVFTGDGVGASSATCGADDEGAGDAAGACDHAAPVCARAIMLAAMPRRDQEMLIRSIRLQTVCRCNLRCRRERQISVSFISNSYSPRHRTAWGGYLTSRACKDRRRGDGKGR